MTGPAPDSLGSSPWRLAAAEVLVALDRTPEGAVPLTRAVRGEPACLAWSDPDRAASEAPATADVRRIAVSDLLDRLPPHVGLLLDPGSPVPVHVPAASRPALIEAGRPFPPHAPVRLAEPAEEPHALLDAVRAAAATLPALRGLWRAEYTVADAPPRLLVAYDVAEVDGADAAAVNLVVQAAESVEHPEPVLVVALPDVPEEHRTWLVGVPAPVWLTGDAS